MCTMRLNLNYHAKRLWHFPLSRSFCCLLFVLCIVTEQCNIGLRCVVITNTSVALTFQLLPFSPPNPLYFHFSPHSHFICSTFAYSHFVNAHRLLFHILYPVQFG